jgi:uncharacterized membrane protein
MNNDGQVVGTLASDHAYLFTGTQVKDLTSELGPTLSAGLEINDQRVAVGVVGTYYSKRAFVYDATSSEVVILDPVPGTTRSEASAINSASQIAALCHSGYGSKGHLVLYEAAQEMRDVGSVCTVRSLNSAGQATGMRSASGVSIVDAYQYLKGTAYRVDLTQDPPLWEDLGVSPLPGHVTSEGKAINDEGVVVGQSSSLPAPDKFSPFVHFPNTSEHAGWHDLQDLLIDAQDWELFDATGINNNGQIVGSGMHNNPLGDRESCGFILTPVESDVIDVLPKHVTEYLAGYILEIGGGSKGGAGIVISPGGKPHPVPPHDPLVSVWRELSPAHRDLAVAQAVDRLAALLQPARQDLLKRAVSDVLDDALREIEQRR